MTNKQARPLTGIRVLDLTQFMSGPFATQILGDLGAEIIKVEPPEGDLSRTIPPHFVSNDSAYYLSLNRNKMSVVLDLKTSEDQATLRRLADSADVVIENFRPGVIERLGLDPAVLQKDRPELIWCSISGFGQDGPYSSLPAYDIIVQALSGGMSLTGEREGRPVRAGVPIADLSAGLYAVIGVLAALFRRNASGIGEYIDISMLDCQVAMLTYQAAYVLAGGERPPPQGRGHESIPTYDSFTASDSSDIVIAASTERMWRDLATELGLADLIDDQRFSGVRERNEARAELKPLLDEAFAKDTAANWVERLRRLSIPVAAVNAVDQILADPQVAMRGMVQTMTADDGRRARVPGDPIHLARSVSASHSYPPALNENADEILRGLVSATTKLEE